MESLELVKPNLTLADEYLAFNKEEVAADARLAGVIPCSMKELEEYIRRRENQELNGDSDTGGVPQSEFWLVRNKVEVIGECRLRHYLTQESEKLAGHVDYGIRASERRKGYGTRQLALLIDEARKLGIQRLLVTCRKNNAGSIGVILNNGGVFENEVSHPKSGQMMQRYWIELG